MSYLSELFERRTVQQNIFRQELHQEALRISKLLINSGFACKKIYLYGSIIKNKPLSRWSDIDIAIEGLNKSLYFKAYACALKNAHFPIDLKPFEELDNSLKEKIRSEGEILYEQK